MYVQYLCKYVGMYVQYLCKYVNIYLYMYVHTIHKIHDQVGKLG